MKQIIFLTGHRKSGTTLLKSLLDGHPDITVYPTDLGLLYAYFPHCKLKKKPKNELIKNIIYQVLKRFRLANKYTKYSNQKMFEYELYLKKKLKTINLLSEKKVILTIIQSWLSFFGIKPKKYILIKETTQSMNYKLLKKIFNKIKIIQIIRDPRDNYASIKSGYSSYYKKIGYDEETLLLSSIIRIKNDLKFAKILSKKKYFYQIKYEKLVKNPNVEIRKLLQFLKLNVNNFKIKPTNSNLEFYGNSYERKIRGISKFNVNRWKYRIHSQEQNFINFYLYDEIKSWNYPNLNNNYFDKFHIKYNQINSKLFYKKK